MTVNSLGINIDGHDSVRVWPCRSVELAVLSFDTEGAQCEIRMDRAVVEVLNAQLPGVLAGLDRVASEEAAYLTAKQAEQRVADVAERALELAAAADKTGAHETAVALRAATEEAKSKAAAVDAAGNAFEEAATDADYAAQRLDYAISQAHDHVRQLRGGTERLL